MWESDPRMDDMPYDEVTVKRSGEIGRVTIDLAPMNVLSPTTIEELEAALTELDGEVSAIIIDSAGEKAFSAGVEVEAHIGDALPDMIEGFGSLFRTMRSLGVPTIAAVDGVALGGGCEVVAGCDMAVASEAAAFGQPEINLGTFPPVAAALFAELMGQKAAFELVMTGTRIDAERARDLGLVNKVVPADELDDAVEELAGSFAEKSSLVVDLAKEAFYEVADGAFEPRLDAADEHSIEITATEDGQEGLRAFMEDRDPDWD